MRTTLALIGLMGMAATAQAQDSGFYAGIGVGQANAEFSDDGVTLEGDDTGFKVFGGYRFTRNFAAEVSYLDGAKVSDSLGGTTFTLESTAFQLSALGIAPVSEMFSVYAKAGLLAWESDGSASNDFSTITSSDDGNDFIYGIGGFLTMGAAALRLELERAEAGDIDLDLISLNLAWTF